MAQTQLKQSYVPDHQRGLIYTMVLVSAADGNMSDNELSTIGELVHFLHCFEGFDEALLSDVAEECLDMLSPENGLERVIAEIKKLVPEKLHETAYLVACETAASDEHLEQEELRLLEMIRHRLDIDRLHAAAIERATRARFTRA